MLLTVSVPGHATALSWYHEVAAIAERGRFDAVLFGGPIDPMPLIVALAASTTWIGLGAAVSMAHTEPFNIARSFAGADRLTGGRTAWLAASEADPRQFGHAPSLTPTERSERAEEGIAVVRKLWDSWEDKAVILDKPAGLFSDPDRVHRIDHAGRWFQVRGPLNAPRPVQGHPVVAVRNDLAFAARTADLFLATDPAAAMAAPRTRMRVLATIGPASAETLAARLRSGDCDGFDLAVADPGTLAAFVDQVVPTLQAQGLLRREYAHGTLRENLGLTRPRSQFAA